MPEDPRAAPSAAFALRLVADLLTNLVNTEVISKKLGHVLIDQALAGLLRDQPEHQESFRDIAATVDSQLELSHADLQVMKRRRELLDDQP